MVLLTMTPSIVEALQLWDGLGCPSKDKLQAAEADLTLEDAAVGKPILHSQIIELWSILRDAGHKGHSLENMLKGAWVYVPPPPPKPEPSNEYKALMARLRREEEQRAYERMTNPPPPVETFAQRFPAANMAKSFAAVNRVTDEKDLGDDDVTYNDVHRQLMLILNFTVSILGVAGTLWVLARWWSTPARLFLTMGGSLLVGIAEIAVYSGYIWHLGEAKKQDKKFKEVKQVVQTWAVGMNEKEEATVIGNKSLVDENTDLRKRKKETAT
ncbi:endoplasmic reticulum-based factor for assembly of V-ATPase-domain-containing protein [Triangularia verruculosa]|uniref:Endoplasmic reticulum-based factor for assembly of V-ATPase-domain-containing protein n=1 Tax=Triangularia verruculosa TaxID=2587418 RepID=A0AAN6XEK5_9PEZI|nr:endoplasmic reticulum-based factor for assembly of V-ATPase-domain-containing protein [Triangularia verruculosa]